MRGQQQQNAPPSSPLSNHPQTETSEVHNSSTSRERELSRHNANLVGPPRHRGPVTDAPPERMASRQSQSQATEATDERDGKGPTQHAEVQSSAHLQQVSAAVHTLGAGPAIGAAGGTSIAQRRQQRRPMGLRLDTRDTEMGLAVHGDGPPPTAHGGWTVRGANVLQTPQPICTRWDESNPSTPDGGAAEARTGFRHNRPAGIIGGHSLRSVESGSGCGTPSEAMDSLTSFQRPMGNSTTAAGGQLARRPEQRPVRAQVGQRVAGLNYMAADELAGRMQGGEGLVIDMRKSADYQQGRIARAISMTVSATLAKRKSTTVAKLLHVLQATDGQRRVASAWKAAPWVALYGEGGAEETACEESLLVLLARKFMAEATDSRAVFVLVGGFCAFERAHYELCEFGCSGAETAGVLLPATPAALTTRPTIKIDHPMLRTMRQTPGGGGGGFDPTETVSMRLPHDFATGEQAQQRLQVLPEYLRRAAEPTNGPQLLSRLFERIDALESRRVSSMIQSNGMVSDDNQYTISAGLELGEKNRYTSIYPFDSNRVRLRSLRRSRDATTTPRPGRATVGDPSAFTRAHGSRPISFDVAGPQPAAPQPDSGTRRSSHRVESRSRGLLFADDDPASEAELAGAEAPGAAKNDYVNASYISYFDGPLYIATQGPLPATVVDFWRMVWEEHTRVIVMLTTEFENGRPKCHRYWPPHEGEASMYGDLCVEFQAEALHPDDSSVIARRLRLTRPAVSDAIVSITHLQYVGWVDHCVPENPLGVLRLRQLARQAQTEGELLTAAEEGADNIRIPMVVHCSAGCGRTGAFCVIDTILDIDERQKNGRSGEHESVPDAASSLSRDVDGDTHMRVTENSAAYAKQHVAKTPDDTHSMFTGMVPLALRSQRPATLQSHSQDLATHQPRPEQEEGNCVTERNNRRSLSQWNERPPSEYHDDLVFMVVSRFRELRITMVQTIKQFVFCHDALAWVALGAGPRPLDHVIDRRLVAEWNRVNHTDLSEDECTDITYLMRGRQEMLRAMLGSEIGGNVAAAASSSAAVPAGRASIDIISASCVSPNEASPAADALSAIKRSNTVGPARRGFFASLFKQSDTVMSNGGGSRDLVDVKTVSPEKQGDESLLRAPSLGPRIGVSASGSVSMLSHVPIAEESPSAIECEEQMHDSPHVASQASMHPQPLFDDTRTGGTARGRQPVPSLQLPSLPHPPPLMSCGIQEPSGCDYFGIVSSSIQSPTNLISVDNTSIAPGFSGVFAGQSPTAAAAADWRRSMMGHVASAYNIADSPVRGHSGTDTAASNVGVARGIAAPASPSAFISNSALASPSAQ
ncbi:phosphotyrosine-specific ptp2-like protein [Coemansia sp. RSA 1365]|nr:phosphotyrosine-specific ptp2-like protein [Coemansia sp. RSA 1365]